MTIPRSVLWYLLRAAVRLLICRRRLKWRIAALEQELRLKRDEVTFLQEQIETYRDTVQAFGLHNRAIGAESATYIHGLSARGH